jgi:hypothetical protein
MVIVQRVPEILPRGLDARGLGGCDDRDGCEP